MENTLQASAPDEAALLRVASVDDDPAEHLIMSMAMTKADYPVQVTYYNSGAALLDSLELLGSDELPHTILLDLRMPGLSGYDILNKLKAHPDYCGIPAVIFTSSERPVERDLALDHGAALFQTKPQDLEAMQTMIGSLPLLVSLHELT